MRARAAGPLTRLQGFARRVCGVVSCGVLACWLWGAAISAHSAWPELHSVRSDVVCRPLAPGGDACELDAVVTLEVPMAITIVLFQEYFRELDLDLAAELRAGRIEQLEERFRSHRFTQLAAALSLRVDGEEPIGSWRPTERFGNGYGLDAFFVYELRFEPSPRLLVDRPHEITLRIDAFARETVMFAHLAQSSEGLAVAETSVPQPPPGTDLEPGSEEELALWSADEARRVFRVSLEPVRP